MDTGLRDAAGRRIKIEHYVFPNGSGFAENHANFFNRGFSPTQIAAGLSEPMLDEHDNPRLDGNGKPLLRGKYSLHPLRHFFCSWLIQRGKPLQGSADPDGSQFRNHDLDRYGHLFPAQTTQRRWRRPSAHC